MRLRSPSPAPAPRRGVPQQPPAAPRLPLSVIHAQALHVPVPPVGHDDDGYPYDDSSMSEGMFHSEAQVYLFNVMRARYGDREDALVCTDQALFFEQGTRSALVVPDSAVAFEVRGGGDGNLLSYKVWEQGKPPDFVMEILSRKTWRNDVHRKPGLYADLNVREYWLFDPDAVSDGPPLRGSQLDAQGAYQPLPPAARRQHSQPAAGPRLPVRGPDVALPGPGDWRAHPPLRGDRPDAPSSCRAG